MPYKVPLYSAKNLPKTPCKNSPKIQQKSGIAKNLSCPIFCPDNFSDKNLLPINKKLTKINQIITKNL